MEIIEFDVFVIGSGIAGQTAAEKCAKNGLKVAIADNREFGGTCAIRGCDPKKILIQFADLYKRTENLKDLGFTKTPKISWEDIISFKDQFTKPVPKSTEEDLEDLDITLFHQSPKFIDKDTILVEGKKVKAKNYIIATGLHPRNLNIPGNQHLLTSDDMFELSKIPESVIFIGAGYIALEFTHLLSTLGCKVTVIDNGETILSQFEPFLTEKLKNHLEKKGVNFIMNTKVESVEKLRKNFRIHYQKNGKKESIKAEKIFNTAGRVPAIEDLDLEKANIKNDKTGVLVNNYLQSISNNKVYSCGDVSSKSLPLTPLSGVQGGVVATNILKKNKREFQDPLVPSVVFTFPNLATVGLTEKEAKERYKNVKVYQSEISHWYNSKKENLDCYAYKIIVNERDNNIVGAHLLSPEAAENINILSMAIANKMTTKEFKRLIFTYPSYTNDLKSMLKG